MSVLPFVAKDAQPWTIRTRPTGPLFARASTPAFRQVNAAFGWHAAERVALKLLAQNLFDEDVQLHIFGDMIGRKVAGQVSIEF